VRLDYTWLLVRHEGVTEVVTYSSDGVEQTRGQRQTGHNDLPGRVRGLLSGW